MGVEWLQMEIFSYCLHTQQEYAIYEGSEPSPDSESAGAFGLGSQLSELRKRSVCLQTTHA